MSRGHRIRCHVTTRVGHLRLAVLCLLLAACGDSSHPPGVTPDAGLIDAGAGAEDAGPDAGSQSDAGPAPTLLSLLPVRGESGGGAWVRLTGSGFVQGVAATPTEAARRTMLKLGEREVRDFQLIDDTSLDLRTPPGAPGPASLTLENPRGTARCEACFTYFESFDLRDLSPAEGALSGGNTVTLVGTGFPTELQVLFGGTASPAVTRVSSTELRVVVPRALSEGPVDVRVHGQGSGGVLRRAYRYIHDPRITDLAPLTGPRSGGTRVVLTGKGFEGTTSVLFGSTPAPLFQVDSPSQLTATTPPGPSAGALDVTVLTPRGTWKVRNGFTYEEATAGTLTLRGVFPHVGTRADGTVTLTGSGLDTPGLAVSFGGQSVPLVTATSTTATVTVPAQSSLPRSVTVSAMSGTESASLSNGYTFRLSLSQVTPDTGPTAGGTQVTVEGTFIPPDAVARVGTLEATAASTPTQEQLRFTTPPGGAGAQSLHVFSASDPENEVLLPATFIYEAPLLLAQVEPSRGAIAGGTRVTVRGAGLGEGTTVTFGGEPATDVQVVDGHTLTCRTPSSRVQAPVEVSITRGTTRAALSEVFTYFDPRGPGGLSGGPLTGTLNVTVLDTSSGAYGQPVAGARVMLGTDAATPLQGVTDARGQLTLSDTRMVGVQVATVFKEGYDAVTVAGIRAENLTVFLRKLTSDGNPGNPPELPPAAITGRVRGFKPPRPLGPNEVLEARIFVAQPSPTSGPPFAGPGDRRADTWRVREDGGAFQVHSQPGLRAVYAVLGVLKDEVDFEPYLLGVRRGIAASSTRVAQGQDVVLDMHLDVTASLTVDGPISVSGQPALHQVYVWLDLGAEGLVPHPHNWGTGTRFFSIIEGPGPRLTFPGLPRLDGASLLFLDLLRGTTTYPQSLLYHRQPGDPAQGMTLGPLLPLPTFAAPPSGQCFTGEVAWSSAPSSTEPDLQRLTLTALGEGSGIRWTAILPAGETHVTLPAPALELLRAGLSEGTRLRADLSMARVPRFEYAQWTYDTLSPATWTAYVLSRSEVFDP
ncbi:IPT/TIG domain-containing protein [Pyxidicoccus sp. MSG2]|uniref:IPT/TIG domain-containing protein n=1 Tax=Pyxidicoccus sp. MSG2 TaxID=2996790 RepID=UPI002271CF8D|nr:IPT/TIG domain-containing protein [Pyxidicoccus sp. MSG2]MCY1019062.1 IPT/TIG domain-containing protein [Pyxidicoccus sp. MSG2]